MHLRHPRPTSGVCRETPEPINVLITNLPYMAWDPMHPRKKGSARCFQSFVEASRSAVVRFHENQGAWKVEFLGAKLH